MNTRVRAATTILIISLSGFGVKGQDSKPDTALSENQSGAAVNDKSHGTDDKPLITKKDLAALQPSWHGRFARAFQYQYQLGEQPRTVLVGSGNTATFVPNPEHYLKQHLITFQFSELFTSGSDKALLVNRVYQNVKANKTAGQTLLGPDVCGRDRQDVIKCVAKGTNAFNRVLSGVTLGIALSERPAVQQGVIVPETFSNHYTVAGQVHFDPSPLFITATNYKDALNNLADEKIDICATGSTKENASVNDRVDECRRRLSAARITGNYATKPRFWDAFLRVALPTFDFKRITQFDFVKNGGILIPAPFPESALNNYTFTWDLRHLIAPTKEHLAAEDAIEAYKPKAQGSKFCVAVLSGQKNYISVADDFKIRDCRDLAKSINAQKHHLGCLTKAGNDAAAPAGTTNNKSENKTLQIVLGDESSVNDLAPPPKDNDNTCRWK